MPFDIKHILVVCFCKSLCESVPQREYHIFNFMQTLMLRLNKYRAKR